MYNNPTYLRSIGLMMFIMLTIGLQAQNRSITQGEYFWDTDPGQGNGTAFVAADGAFDDVIEHLINTSVNIPTSLGNHTFHIRTQDQDGTWGTLFSVVIPVTSSLLSTRAIEITAGEYFWGNDPGQGNGTPFLATDGTFNETLENLINTAVSIPSTTGVHLLHTRTRDVENNWGPVFTVVVEIRPNLSTKRTTYVKSAEYFFDNDPGPGNATPIFAQDGNFNTVLEAIIGGAIPSPVAAGIHTLYIRAQDVTNDWGPAFGIVVNMDITLTANLPVEFISFKGWHQDYKNVLEWITESELNSASFEIERSIDGSSFEWIGSVPAAGNSNVLLTYLFEDKIPSIGVNYYRLRQIDLDGSFKYSNTIAIEVNGNWGTQVLYPNPTAGLVNYQFTTNKEESRYIQVLDVLGKTIKTITIQTQIGINTFDLDLSGYANGTYLILVTQASGQVLLREKVVKQ